jgi:hypothetical protein
MLSSALETLVHRFHHARFETDQSYGLSVRGSLVGRASRMLASKSPHFSQRSTSPGSRMLCSALRSLTSTLTDV